MRQKKDPFNNETVKLIIELGADPNAIDQNGRTPLHLLADNFDINWELNVSMFKTLVDAGTHLDMAANDGKTVLDVLKRNLERSHRRRQVNQPISTFGITHRFPIVLLLCTSYRSEGNSVRRR
jgi:hypothetical protein